ncbi:MAG: hypothetical protein ABIZ52_00870 [Candidatus Limnocylindrales bacterium]
MDAEIIRRDAYRLLADGAAAEALATLEAGAERLAAAEPANAAALLVDAAAIGHLVTGPERAVSIAERAVEGAASVGGFVHRQAVVRLGDALSWAGRYEDATMTWRQAAAATTNSDPRLLGERANALVRLGDPGAHDAVYRYLVAARAAADQELILDALNLVTVAEVQAGRLRERSEPPSRPCRSSPAPAALTRSTASACLPGPSRSSATSRGAGRSSRRPCRASASCASRLQRAATPSACSN